MKKIAFLSILLWVLSFKTVLAQGPPPPPPDPDDVPIDGGLGWLMAGGIGYGVYQYKKRKRESAHDSL